MKNQPIVALAAVLVIAGPLAHAQSQPAQPAPSQAEPGDPRTPDREQPDHTGAPGPAADRAAESGEATRSRPTRPDSTVIDFSEEEGFGVGEVVTTEDPEPIEHPPLLRKKYRAQLAPDTDSVDRRGDGSALSVGFAAGASVAMIAADTPDSSMDADDGASLGAIVNGFLIYRISRNVALQPAVGFAVKGSVPGPAGDRLRLSYVSLPVIARVDLEPGLGDLGLHLGAGASLGVALSSSRGTGEEELMVEPLGIDAVGMVGASFGAGAGRLAISMRYEHGLTAAATLRTATSRSEFATRALSLTAGYVF